MASALLASRNEPHWGEEKVYMRQNPNCTSSLSNPNKRQQIHDPLPSTTQQNPHGRYQHLQQQQSSNFPIPDAPSISNEPSSSSHNRNPNEIQNRRGGGGGVGFGESTGYVKFNISGYSKKQLKDLKRRFVSELHQIRALSCQIESRQSSSSSRSGSVPGRGLKRPFPFAEPKRGPPPPSMAETKLVKNMMKRCGTILKKLMTHFHGYIFNEPVDPIKENLHDYTSIIRNPMDLGTVKRKLTNNLYKTPLEFASDVRLTFGNALLYNPKGHEVSVLAEILVKQFNESFEPALKKFENDRKKLGSSVVVPIGVSDDELERERPCAGSGYGRQMVLPSSTTPDRTPDRIMHKPPPFIRGNSNTRSTKQLLLPPQPVPPIAQPVYQQAVKQMSGGRPWTGKEPKPKAKDTNKRNMSIAEKEKLIVGLQNLPRDKLDQALQIIRKRNAGLCQEGDEIELDIEAMDIETLWELDRLMSNYKKILIKMRKQSLSDWNQHYPAVEGNKSPIAVEMPELKNKKSENIGMEEDVDIGEDIPTSNFPPVEIEKDAGYASDNKSGASSDSSSSDDSSSDSDSDSGSSSGTDSDADEAQSPFIGSKSNKPNDGFD